MKPANHSLRFRGAAMWLRLMPMACLLLILFPTSAQAQTDQTPFDQLAPEAQAVFQAINQRRAENGLAPLTLHPLLNQAAQGHVDDMVAHGIFGHVGSDGSFVRQRVQRVGYSAGGYASENWVSAISPETAMNWWMNDWIHRVNILNPRWQEIGVGVGSTASGRMIFVTDFTAGNGIDDNLVDPAVAAPSAAGDGMRYTIQPGDTLIGIAARYGLDWTQIAQANEMHEEELLQIGQTLRLPGVHAVGGDEQVVTTSQAQTSTFIPAAPNPDGKYTVQPGDTLLGVALRYHLTWQELAAANGLAENDLLQIGQQLTIPAVSPVAAAPGATQTEPVYYVIQDGDTIFSIAIQQGLDWQTLLTLNGLSESSVLQIGQQIRLQ